MTRNLLLSLALLGAFALPAAADHRRCGTYYRPRCHSAYRGYRYDCGDRCGRAVRCDRSDRYERSHGATRYYVCRDVRPTYRCFRYRSYVGIAPMYARFSMDLSLDGDLFDGSAETVYNRVVEPAEPIGSRFLLDCE